VFLSYSTNHLLTSPYFIAVYVLLALLFLRRLVAPPQQAKTFKKQ